MIGMIILKLDSSSIMSRLSSKLGLSSMIGVFEYQVCIPLEPNSTVSPDEYFLLKSSSLGILKISFFIDIFVLSPFLITLQETCEVGLPD